MLIGLHLGALRLGAELFSLLEETVLEEVANDEVDKHLLTGVVVPEDCGSVQADKVVADGTKGVAAFVSERVDL